MQRRTREGDVDRAQQRLDDSVSTLCHTAPPFSRGELAGATQPLLLTHVPPYGGCR
jgi:hypothetical protein